MVRMALTLAIFALATVRARECIHADVVNIATDEWRLDDCTSLQIAMKTIGEDGAKALAVALKDNKVLRSLRLRHAGIGNGAKDLAAVLATTQLKELEIWRSGVDASGCAALASAVEGSTLQVLDLRYNKVGDEGATALANTLKSSTQQLTALRLQNAGVGPAGAVALAEALRGPNIKLEVLDLGNNPLGAEGGKALEAALEVNTYIGTLNIQGCKLDSLLEFRIARIIAKLDEYLPVTKRMGMHKVGNDVLHLVTLEDLDPWNESKATEEQRGKIESALTAYAKEYEEAKEKAAASPPTKGSSSKKKKKTKSKDELRRLAEKLEALRK